MNFDLNINNYTRRELIKMFEQCVKIMEHHGMFPVLHLRACMFQCTLLIILFNFVLPLRCMFGRICR